MLPKAKTVRVQFDLDADQHKKLLAHIQKTDESLKRFFTRAGQTVQLLDVREECGGEVTVVYKGHPEKTEVIPGPLRKFLPTL